MVDTYNRQVQCVQQLIPYGIRTQDWLWIRAGATRIDEEFQTVAKKFEDFFEIREFFGRRTQLIP